MVLYITRLQYREFIFKYVSRGTRWHKKRDGSARKERKWKSNSVVTAAVVAAAVDLAGILDVLMPNVLLGRLHKQLN